MVGESQQVGERTLDGAARQLVAEPDALTVGDEHAATLGLVEDVHVGEQCRR